MRKIVLILMALSMLQGSTCFAFSFSNASSVYAANARNYAKYYPTTNNYNRYARPQKSYVYSEQQARYYGYRVPQQTTQNGYYNGGLR